MSHREQCFTPFQALMGTGRRDISPPVGIFNRNWGAASTDVSKGNHRPLLATVLAIRAAAESEPLLLVSMDHGFFTTVESERSFRQQVLDHFKLDESRLLICLSHAHATTSLTRDDEHRPGGHLLPAYIDNVIRLVIEAAQDALDSVVPATLTWRYGKCDLATNRDYVSPDDGRILTGFNPQGTADDTLLVGRVTRDSDQSILATIVNYACHPTILAWENHLVSPDYLGAMREVVERETNQAACLFIQGASGDLAPAWQYTGDTSLADLHGRRLGHAVVATLLGMTPPGTQLAFQGVVESGAVLAVWKPAPVQSQNEIAAKLVPLSLPLKKLPTLRELDEQIAQCDNRVMAERLLRQRRRLAPLEGRTHFDTHINIWRLGSALIVVNPHEAYSKWQLTLRAIWPDQPVVVGNMVNAALSYLVPEENYSDKLYACWASLPARGAFEIFMQTSLEAARQVMQESQS